MTFNQLLTKLKTRRANEGSYREFAERLGYSHSTMWAWESGKRNIRLRQFVDWAQALGFRVELVDDDGE